jgi:hypothetical protein
VQQYVRSRGGGNPFSWTNFGCHKIRGHPTPVPPREARRESQGLAPGRRLNVSRRSWCPSTRRDCDKAVDDVVAS